MKKQQKIQNKSFTFNRKLGKNCYHPPKNVLRIEIQINNN